MIKLFAIDLDDTFFDSRDRMSPENVQAVKDLTDAGVKVIINSGRSEYLMRQHIKDLGLGEYRHIAVNGALILDPDEEKNELISYFDPDTYRKFIQILRDDNRGFFLYHTHGLLYERPDGKLMDHLRRYHTLNRACEGDAMKIDRCCRIAVIRESQEDVPHLVGLAPEGVYATARPAGSGVNYMPEGINKGTALKMIMDEYGVKKEEAASIGDQVVDSYMFAETGLSFAVANSDEKTKETADIVLPRTNSENAFAYAVYRYVLKDETKLSKV